MAKELLTDFSTYVKERRSSPIFTVFLISFFGYNWRIAVILLYGPGQSWYEIAFNIDAVLSTGSPWLVPSLTTAVVILSYPWISAGVSILSDAAKTLREHMANRIAGRRLLSKEESAELRLQHAKMLEQVEEIYQENKQLNRDLSALRSKGEDDLRSSRDSSASKDIMIAKLNEEIQALKAPPQKEAINEGHAKILTVLHINGGRIRSDLIEESGFEKLKAERLIDQLYEKSQIARSGTNGSLYITPEGRAALDDFRTRVEAARERPK